jgi:hypothetical protein
MCAAFCASTKSGLNRAFGAFGRAAIAVDIEKSDHRIAAGARNDCVRPLANVVFARVAVT